jgi:uncharacterized phiE125 gp8 family phage protein
MAAAGSLLSVLGLGAAGPPDTSASHLGYRASGVVAPLYRAELVLAPDDGWGGFVTLADCKDHLRVAHDQDDGEITAFRDTAALYVLDYARTQGLAATFRVRAPGFPGGCGSHARLALPGWARPTVTIGGLAYTDADGDEQALAAGTDYALDAHADAPALLPLGAAGWPRTRREAVGRDEGADVTVTVRAGADDAAGVDRRLKQATLMVLTDLYEQRGASNAGSISHPVWASVGRLLAPLRGARVVGVA